MAGRALNRLRKHELPDLAPPAEEEESSQSEDEEEASAPFNPFSLLTDDEDEPQAKPDSDEEEEKQPSSQPDPSAAGGSAGRGSGGKQRKKKKKGGGGKGKLAAADEGDTEGGPGNSKAEEEDIDAILQELNITPAPAGPASTQQRAAGQHKPLLAVDTRNLRADDELKRMFGTRIMEAEGEEDGAAGGLAGASRRVRRLAARGLLRRQALKPGVMIQPKDHWPRFDGGVNMEQQGLSAEGRPIYTYVYSQTYLAVQDLYEECQATFDPNAIAGLLQAHPYHLDSLLTMHDLYRSMGENSYADEMLERCVYALEMALHPSFWGAAGSLHVPYEEENMPLFVALFRYMQTLSRRGLHRTALETCKLLLGLNSDDPMGALCCIDYLALRAGQYAWLHRLIDEHGSGLPNMVYSQALCRWHQEREAAPNRARGGTASSSRSGGSPAAASQQQQQGQQQQEQQQASSLDLLVTAVQMHPLVVVRLQSALQDKGVGHEGEWAALLRHPLFASGGGRDSASLCHLIDIFVERQHLLWKAAEVQAWLRAACAQAVDPDASGVKAEDWACMREQAFPASEVNLYRHLRVADFSDAVNRLPPEEMHGVHAGAAMQEPDMAALQDMMQQAQGNMTNEELQAANPLAMLLRTLLPWVNVGQEPGAEGQEEGAAVVVAAAAAAAAAGVDQQQQHQEQQQQQQQQPGQGHGPTEGQE